MANQERAEKVRLVFESFKQLKGSTPDFLKAMFVFISETYEAEYTAEFLETACRLIPEEAPTFRSIADELISRGEARGMCEGLRQGAMLGRADTLMRQLRHRFDSVPAAAEQRIRQADMAHLDAWLDRILEGKTVEEVLADS